MSSGDNDLDPRIQIELENLNSATNQINKLEIELEEANSTFRILLNESTRRLKVSSKKLGNCIDKARPYYETLEKAREAQIECQIAARKFQKASEIHAAAKETVALAEQRFMSNSHEWQFDNAWQEMLNHATQKVMDAEKQKADSHAEHQRRFLTFNAAEKKVQQLEDRFRRSISKSRPYFEEKQICQDQLQTQKNRIQELQAQVQAAKATYSKALRNLELISDEIHQQRGDFARMVVPPPGPREPVIGGQEMNTPLPDFNFELEKCDASSNGGSDTSLTISSLPSSERDNDYDATVSFTATNIDNNSETEEDNCCCDVDDEHDLEELRKKVKTLAVRPVEVGNGQQEKNLIWENELNATVDKLDHLMMIKECAEMEEQQQQQQLLQLQKQNHIQIYNTHRLATVGEEIGNSVKCILPNYPIIELTTTTTSPTSAIITKCLEISTTNLSSLPVTPDKHSSALKKLKKLDPLPSVNVSMRELPLLARLSTEILDRSTGYSRIRRRSLD